MPSVELPKASISFDGILYALALLVAIAGVVVAVVKGWEAWKKISVRDRVANLEDRMEKVEARLVLGDQRFQSQSDDLGQVLISVHAIVQHMISGNDKDKLQATDKELIAYMAKRKMEVQQQ